MRELIETRKQRELTVDEKKEAARLFKDAVSEAILNQDAPQSTKGITMMPQAEKERLRRQFEQHMPDSPEKTKFLRKWELADARNQRVLTAEEKAELLQLLMPMFEKYSD